MNELLHLAYDGCVAEICPGHGANLVRFAVPSLGVEALRTPECLVALDGPNPFLFGMPPLFPPNRISGGVFAFQGRTYRWPIDEPELGNALHGALYRLPFEVEAVDGRRAVCRYQATAGKPYLLFPHAFTLRITYTLGDGGVDQTVSVTNDSDLDMPVALGFHTTFRLPFVAGSCQEDMRLMLEVGDEYVRDPHTHLPTGETLIDHPLRDVLLAGTFAPAAQSESRHYAMAGQRRMLLTDQRTGISLCYQPDKSYRYWLLFNGGRSDILCVEPQTWIVNCPNAPYPPAQTGFLSLSPGASKQWTCRLSLCRSM